MIIWGSGGDVINLGGAQTRRCDTCERDRPFNLVLRYHYAHLCYLSGWVTEKKYLLLCNICRHGRELDIKKIETNLLRVPIPFTHRFGGVVGLAVVACAILLAMTGGKQSRIVEEEDSAHEAPHRPSPGRSTRFLP